MSKTTTIGVFHNRVDAEGAIMELKDRGILDANISYLTVHHGDDVVTNERRETVHGDGGTASGVMTGAVIGTIAGLAVAEGVLPGLGALLVAGPIATALGLTGVAATTAAGAITGAAAGGIIGALVDIGVPEEEAHIYEQRLRTGGHLVTVRSDSLDVIPVFEKYHAEEVREYR
jgi:hypothetical protein